MADPLSLLRQFNIDKQDIIEEGNNFVFGKHSWPKNTETNYIIQKSGKDDRIASNEYYTLECLVYFLKNAHLIHPDYVKKATEENIPVVRRPFRKALLAYLNGGPAVPGVLDDGVILKSSTHIKRSIKRESNNELDSKKPKLEESQVTLTKSVQSNLSKGTLVTKDKTCPIPISEEKIKEMRAKRLAKINNKDKTEDMKL